MKPLVGGLYRFVLPGDPCHNAIVRVMRSDGFYHGFTIVEAGTARDPYPVGGVGSWADDKCFVPIDEWLT